ncbi:aminopeptidase P family protein [Crocosphaera sp. UHCC 0190]|uniref:aminopeptidase P family protein n=1 Tax=Crocosphaera sp. UHCC 0190 TaxID=3110246 RepID=UPI002B220C77|nr:aminopeptidase P family protein [Crocosphaera sp. UHCC 0190]MEA5512199.1 aminopeptidase P family protein [Crocosphaera sp. UHCC 0190]
MNDFLIYTLQQRRQKLAQLIDKPAIFWSGKALSRNFRANRYPFRASSHFLYFTGLNLENAAIIVENGNLSLFMDNPSPDSTLWHGEMPTREDIAAQIGANQAYPLTELGNHTTDALTIPVQDVTTYQQQWEILNRSFSAKNPLTALDLDLVKAIVTLRLSHDKNALTEIKKAASVAITSHKIGMKVSKNAQTEAEIRGAMEGYIMGQNMTCAYNSIVTVHGEVLHNEHYHHHLQSGDLLLADVGAETSLGWASDITRTWPVNGQFSPTQRDIYDLVLAAHDACIEQIKPGQEYREIHLLAAKIIAEGLVNLGILRGNPETLVEKDAHALFFPHGIGHLLGLDVHDMEDLGDLAGYELGRSRSQRFGLGYLRLDRPLKAGMVVTIEPGFYQVPAILNNPQFKETYDIDINWDKLAQFSDVKGVRIEDDILVTEMGAEILTVNLPTHPLAIEALVNEGVDSGKTEDSAIAKT